MKKRNTLDSLFDKFIEPKDRNPEPCWIWTGSVMNTKPFIYRKHDPNGGAAKTYVQRKIYNTPVVSWNNVRTNPARILYNELVTPLNSTRRLINRPGCDQRCVNPFHKSVQSRKGDDPLLEQSMADVIRVKYAGKSMTLLTFFRRYIGTENWQQFEHVLGHIPKEYLDLTSEYLHKLEGVPYTPSKTTSAPLLANLKTLTKMLEIAFDYDGDVFGIHHNEAVDVLSNAHKVIAQMESP